MRRMFYMNIYIYVFCAKKHGEMLFTAQAERSWSLEVRSDKARRATGDAQ